MQSSFEPSRFFKDFAPTYIEGLAQAHGMVYSASTVSTDQESSLYNNERTATEELFKLDMTVDGLPCEYYTARYLPLMLTGAQDKLDEQRTYVQIFSVTLPYEVEPVYIESQTNSTLNNLLELSSVTFKGGQRVELEADFSRYFRVHVPENGELGAFTILAPNVMMRLLENAGNFDFEFTKNKVYFYQTFPYTQPFAVPLTKSQYDNLLAFGVESARAMARAARPAKQLSGARTAMWQIYGANSNKAARMMTIIVFGLFFVFTCIIIPLLWPVLFFIWLYGYLKYKRLKRKKQQLIERWQSGKDVQVIKA